MKGKKMWSLLLVAMLVFVFSIPAFASTGTDVAITSEMLEPVTDMLIANIQVILPIAVVIFGILVGISLVPKILNRFKNGG